MEFIYCGSRLKLALEASGLTANLNVALELERLVAKSSLIEVCMRLYDVADFLLCPSLQREIKMRFSQHNDRKSAPLQKNNYTKRIDGIGGIIHDLRTAYSWDTPSGEVFRDLMNSFVHVARYRFFRCPEFIAVLDEIPQLASSLLKGMIESGEFAAVMDPRQCSGCRAAKSAEEFHSHTMLQQGSALQAFCSRCVSSRKLGSERTDWQDRWSGVHESIPELSLLF